MKLRILLFLFFVVGLCGCASAAIGYDTTITPHVYNNYTYDFGSSLLKTTVNGDNISLYGTAETGHGIAPSALFRQDYNLKTQTWGERTYPYIDSDSTDCIGTTCVGAFDNKIYIFFLKTFPGAVYKYGYINSTDLTGNHWSDFNQINISGRPGACPFASIQATDDPNIIAVPFYDNANATAGYWSGVVLFNLTSKNFTTTTIYNGSKQYDEISISYLGNGKFVALLRQDGNSGPLNESVSSDNANTWTVPATTNLGASSIQVSYQYYDNLTGNIVSIFTDRGTQKINISETNATTVFNNPLAWNTPKILDSNWLGYPAILPIQPYTYFYVYNDQINSSDVQIKSGFYQSSYRDNTRIVDNKWSHYTNVTLNTSKVCGNQTYFPYIISTVNNTNLSNYARYDGNDIRFVMNGTVLNYDKINYNYSRSGVNATWCIQIPHLSNISNPVVIMEYGYLNAADGQNVTGTYDDGGCQYFQQVMHLKENGTGNVGDYIDSTVFGSGSISTTNQPMQVNGLIYKGQYFNGSTKIQTSSHALQNQQCLTVSFLIKPTSFPTLHSYAHDVCDSPSIGSGYTSFGLLGPTYLTYTNTYETSIAVGGGDTVAVVKNSNYPLGQWYHYACIFNGSESTSANKLKMVINGVAQSISYDGAVPSTTKNTGNTYYTTLGENGNYFDNVTLEELRISNCVRSLEWEQTENNNLMSVSSSADFGADYINVSQGIAVSNFTSDVSSGVAPLTVQFTDCSAGGGPYNYSWNFGDGDSSTLQNPAHTYNTAGTFTVTLNVTNAIGSNTSSQLIIVSANNANGNTTSNTNDFKTNCINSMLPVIAIIGLLSIVLALSAVMYAIRNGDGQYIIGYVSTAVLLIILVVIIGIIISLLTSF